MGNFDRKAHWEKVYQTTQLNEVGWYQAIPETSLQFFKQLNIPLDASIIDVGGGDSFLVDHLLKLGYTDISVLDISETALKRAKRRLGNKAEKVNWIISDAVTFEPKRKYDFWHDRAAFHFLRDEEEIKDYIKVLNNCLNKNGHLILGTFSIDGPTKCSGIEIKQYSEEILNDLLDKQFSKSKCINIEHITPSNTIHKYIFCSFKKFSLN